MYAVGASEKSSLSLHWQFATDNFRDGNDKAEDELGLLLGGELLEQFGLLRLEIKSLGVVDIAARRDELWRLDIP